ncbi:MAG: hypothetical protein ACLFSD_00025 [Salinivenus sp.]
MTDTDPDIDDALDGLQTASRYCDNHGYETLSAFISTAYQLLGARDLGETDNACDDNHREQSGERDVMKGFGAMKDVEEFREAVEKADETDRCEGG